MKRFLLAAVLTIAALAAAPLSAQAALLKGQLDYTGTFKTATGSFLTSTAFDVLTSSVDIATLDFATLTSPGDPIVHFTPIAYVPPAFPINPLWTHVASGLYFDLASYTVGFKTKQVLVMTGTGTFYAAGFSATPGTWIITMQRPGGTGDFLEGSYSSSASVGIVPEPGLLTLFGGGLLMAGRSFRNRRKV